MPIFKFNDLVTTNAPTVDSVIPCVQNNVTKQLSILQIKQYLDDGTLKELSSGDGYQCNPNPITSTGSVSFYAPGLMSLYAGASAPTGWLLCDGSSVVVATYQDLFNKIGYTYGGSGVNFNLPNLVGRTAFGLDNMAGTAASRATVAGSTTLGSNAGAIEHILTADQTPLVSHTHAISGSFSVGAGPDRTGNNQNLFSGAPRRDFNTSGGGCATTLSLSIAASSSATSIPQTSPHPNLPPFLIINWIIKT